MSGQITDIPFASGNVVVGVSCALVDAVHLSRASAGPVVAFVGHVRAEQQSQVVGVGSLGARLIARSELLRPIALNGGPLEHAPLSLFLGPLIVALTDAGLKFGDRVLIAGEGLVGQLAAQVTRLYTGVPPRVVTQEEFGTLAASSGSTTGNAERERDVDVLIETTADSRCWPQLLPLVRRMGRVVFLIPPGPQLHPFDFYRGIHKGSFTMRAHRVPAVPAADLDDAGRFSLHLLETGQITVNGLLEEIDLSASEHEGLAGLGVYARAGLIFRFDER